MVELFACGVDRVLEDGEYDRPGRTGGRGGTDRDWRCASGALAGKGHRDAIETLNRRRRRILTGAPGGNTLCRNEDLPCLPAELGVERAGLPALRTPVYPSDRVDQLDCHIVVCVAGRFATGDVQVSARNLLGDKI